MPPAHIKGAAIPGKGGKFNLPRSSRKSNRKGNRGR